MRWSRGGCAGGAGGGRGGGRGGAVAAAASASTSRRTAASTGSLAVDDPSAPARRLSRACRTSVRSCASAAAICRRSPSIRRTRTSSTAASTVFWRTEDGGLTWSAVRGAPGGDDYQKTWINPNNPNILLVVADQGGVVSGNRGKSLEQLVHAADGRDVSRLDGQRVPVSRLRRTAGLRLGVRRQPLDGRRDHVPRLASGQHPGVRRRRARSEESRPRVRQPAHERVAVQSQDRADDDASDRAAKQRGTAFGRNVRTMPINWSPLDPHVLFYASNAVWKTTDQAHSWTRISPDLARQTWAVPATVGKYASSVTPAPHGLDHRALAVAARRQGALGRHRRRQHPGDDRRRREVDERHAAADQAVDAHLQHRRRSLRQR